MGKGEGEAQAGRVMVQTGDPSHRTGRGLSLQIPDPMTFPPRLPVTMLFSNRTLLM